MFSFLSTPPLLIIGLSMKYFSNFADEFFFATAGAVLLLMLVDWLIGANKRDAMRLKMEEWWLGLQEATFTGLIARDAALVETALSRYFGRRFWSIKPFLSAAVISVLVTAILITILVVLPDFLTISMPVLSFFYSETSSQKLFNRIVSFAFQNALLDWLSLFLTIYFLGVMARSVSVMRLFTVIILDIFAAALLTVFVYFSGVSALTLNKLTNDVFSHTVMDLSIDHIASAYSLAEQNFRYNLNKAGSRAYTATYRIGADGELYVGSIEGYSHPDGMPTNNFLDENYVDIPFGTPVGQLANYTAGEHIYALVLRRTNPNNLFLDKIYLFSTSVATFFEIMFTSDKRFSFLRHLTFQTNDEVALLVVALTSALPTLIHLLLSLSFLISKLFRPLVQPIVSLLLLRFSESSRGPLTLIAVGVGTAAKFGQQALNVFGG